MEGIAIGRVSESEIYTARQSYVGFFIGLKVLCRAMGSIFKIKLSDSMQVLFITMLVSCGAGNISNKNGSQIGNNNRTVPSALIKASIKESWFTRVLQKSVFNCDGECPSSIGMVGFFEEDFGEDTFVKQCTGFVVSPTIIATNSHCIPQIVKDESASCNEHLGFVIPKNNGSKTVRLCKKILAMSSLENGMDLDDYAFIQVDAMAEPPLTISQSGLSDSMPVRVQKINPNEDQTLGGSFETIDCKTVQNSLLNLYYINDFSRTALAVGCEARGGNSGAPVFNSSGEVVGLLQSKKVSDYLFYLGQQLARKNNLEIPFDPPEHFVFSNMACIPHPISGIANASPCAHYRDRNLAFIFNQIVDQNMNASEKIRAQWFDNLPKNFEYQIEETKGFATIFTAVPFCFKKDFLDSTLPDIYDLEIGDFLRIVKNYALDEFLRFLPQAYYTHEVLRTKYKIDTHQNPPELFVETFVGKDRKLRQVFVKKCTD